MHKNEDYTSGTSTLTQSLKNGILKVDCELSDWYKTKECDKECGGGIEVWERDILIHPLGLGKSCEETIENRPCNTEECHPCSINNGNCSKNAYCSLNDEDKVICTCKEGYEGDGYTCDEKYFTERIKLYI